MQDRLQEGQRQEARHRADPACRARHGRRSAGASRPPHGWASRHTATKRPRRTVEYYAKLPEDIANRDVIVVDPMLATGRFCDGHRIPAQARRGRNDQPHGDRCRSVGIECVLDADPDVQIFTCAIDEA